MLSRPSNLDLIIEHRAVADRELQVVPRLDMISALLYSSSAGRSLLALESDARVRELFRVYDGPAGQQADDILRQLAIVRKQGFACDGGELMEGITTMAVAIDSLPGRFAVSCPIPSVRFDKHQHRYLDELMACKTDLLREVGSASS